MALFRNFCRCGGLVVGEVGSPLREGSVRASDDFLLHDFFENLLGEFRVLMGIRPLFLILSLYNIYTFFSRPGPPCVPSIS